MFYKTKEVAEKLSVTKMTISNMVSRGQLKPINNDPRYLLFDKKQIDDLILIKIRIDKGELINREQAFEMFKIRSIILALLQKKGKIKIYKFHALYYYEKSQLKKLIK